MNKVLLAVGVLVLIIVVAPIFLPTKFTMSRTTEINAPLSSVFTPLTDLNVYVKWNPFPEGDPTNEAHISGTGVGSYLTWKGNKTGEGKMIIAGIEPEQKITVKMEFYKPMAGEGVVSWFTTAKSTTVTEVVWSFEQDLSYFKRYFGLIMESMMGKHFEKGLLNFKNLIESGKT